MTTKPPASPPTERLEESPGDSPQALTVRLDAEEIPPTDQPAERERLLPSIRGSLAGLLAFIAFLGMVVFTVPMEGAISQELGRSPILQTLTLIFRFWLSFYAARYVYRAISRTGPRLEPSPDENHPRP